MNEVVFSSSVRRSVGPKPWKHFFTLAFFFFFPLKSMFWLMCTVTRETNVSCRHSTEPSSSFTIKSNAIIRQDGALYNTTPLSSPWSQRLFSVPCNFYGTAWAVPCKRYHGKQRDVNIIDCNLCWRCSFMCQRRNWGGLKDTVPQKQNTRLYKTSLRFMYRNLFGWFFLL